MYKELENNNESVKEIARSSLMVRYFGVYAFKFYHPQTGEKIAVASNLTDLLIHLGTIPDDVFFYYLQKGSEYDAQLALRGDGSWLDLTLWISYVLGDQWLSNEISTAINNPDEPNLRSKIIRICQARHESLRRLLMK